MIYLLKSRIREHLRTTKSGKITVVQEHTDKRTKKDDLDRKSENYRYRDVGHVPGSRKELAEQQALRLRQWAKEGRGVTITDVDWDALESNPREAKDLITKEIVMKAADWDDMQKRKVEPGAAYLIYKLYSAVAPKPQDSPESRKDFVFGINALQDRFAKVKTADDVVKALAEIREEMTGFSLTPEQEKQYKALNKEAEKVAAVYRALSREKDAVWEAYYQPSLRLQSLQWDQENRTRRGWKLDPELQQRIDGLTKEVEVLYEKDQAWRKKYGPKLEAAEKAYREVNRKRIDFKRAVTSVNVLTHPLTRGFNSLGDRFLNAVDYRSSRGSESFGKHVATAKAGRIKDYGFLSADDKERTAPKRSVRFQLRVADSIKREGGRPLDKPEYGTDDLKKQFALANVQSGNWVLNDLNAAKHHVEQTALAFQDMADMLGLPEKDISLHGRLSMAFGARGHGLSGAAAHYEPVYRVINLTKMKGGGSLAHEWLHALDDITGEVESGVKNGEKYATAAGDSTPTLKAFHNVVKVMTDGEHGIPQTLKITESEAAHWRTVFERRKKINFYGASGMKMIHDAGNLQTAMEKLWDGYGRGIFGKVDGARARREYDAHKQVAVAVYAGTSATYNTPGVKGSRYFVEAKKIDAEENRTYWSSTKELAARAFAAYISDKLHAAKRENTYLSSYADNKYYVTDDIRPYPEGDERKKINKAFDELFKTLRKEKTLKKAIRLLIRHGRH